MTCKAIAFTGTLADALHELSRQAGSNVTYVPTLAQLATARAALGNVVISDERASPAHEPYDEAADWAEDMYDRDWE